MPNIRHTCRKCGTSQDVFLTPEKVMSLAAYVSKRSDVGCSGWLDAAEVKAALLSSIWYYEREDKDDWLYLIRPGDLDSVIEAIVAAGRAKASNAKLTDTGGEERKESREKI